MKQYYFFFVAVILLSVASIAWTGYARFHDFKDYHTTIAQEVTSSTKESIKRYISERRRLVTIFAKSNRDTIINLINNPEDDEIRDEISARLKYFFPNHFTFTVADEEGNPFYADFDGLIGEQCINDIKRFSRTNQHFPRLHPNPELYHFDIMVPFKYNNSNLTFFVSFDAALLGNILRNAHVPSHELMLILPVSERKVIEITEQGARITLDRLDFRLAHNELERILFERKVEGTSWSIVDFRKKTLFTNYIQKLSIELLVIFVLILLTTSLMLIYIKREQHLKNKAQQHKADFLSVVSHELRTPLTSIKGALSLITNGVTGEIPEKTQQLSTMALGNTDRLINLVNDLLDVQKIEAGKISLELVKSNLSEQVRLAIQSIEGYGQQFNVKYQLTDLLPNTIVNIDENRFQQILNNLLSNAAKYGGNNNIVDISIVPYEGQVRISVTDYGKGIPESFQGVIFEKFSQHDNKDNQKVKSTGLGLHIVKQIVTLHKGNINFYTGESGSTFYIDLPICNE